VPDQNTSFARIPLYEAIPFVALNHFTAPIATSRSREKQRQILKGRCEEWRADAAVEPD
jgi:hypothetical protein